MTSIKECHMNEIEIQEKKITDSNMNDNIRTDYNPV